MGRHHDELRHVRHFHREFTPILDLVLPINGKRIVLDLVASSASHLGGGGAEALRKTYPCFECFPYVCPEPALAK